MLYHLHSVLALSISLVLLVPVESYVPGLARKDYKVGEKIEIKMNGLTSIKAQLPYSYYRLPFCQPSNLKTQAETLGEVLMGERVENSNYEVHFGKDQFCQELCRVRLGGTHKAMIKQLIDDQYSAEWLADGLPAVSPQRMQLDPERAALWYTLGFPVGWKERNGTHTHYYLNNYFSIILKYRQPKGTEPGARFLSTPDTGSTYSIVGFEVVPMSFYTEHGGPGGCDVLALETSYGLSMVETSLLAREAIPSEKRIRLDLVEEFPILYDVKFQPSTLDYTQRWDTYLMSQRIRSGSSMEIHWFSIVNSLVIVFVLSGIVAMILNRTLKRDIIRYNELVLGTDDEVEETGWKLVHGDVFRKPQHSTILVALVGSGIQTLCMVLAMLSIGAIGLRIHPGMGFGRGRLIQASLLIWSLMGIISGYIAARFYKLFQSPNWKMTTMRTAMMYPGCVFTIFFVVNLFLWGKGSSAAAPFGTIFLLMMIWLGISAPLVFVGAYYGFKQPAISIPVRVNKIPRQIPTQPWIAQSLVACLAGGALPFGAVFTELVLVFSSLWQHRAFVLFGLLLLVAVILILTSAEVTIAVIYFQLACENYNWWWKSFFIPGSAGIYVFIYSIIYACTRLSLSHLTSVVLYIGYSLIIAYTFAIMTGAIGFVASFLFVRSIYGSIRID